VGYRVVLRRLCAADETEFVQRALDSVDLHRGWQETPTDPAEFRAYLTRFADPDRARAFAVRGREDEILVGWTTLSRIEGFPYHRAVLGYTGFVPGVGQGYMAEAVGLTIRYGFETLGLHRIEADVEPRNVRSRRILERLGFRQEGFSPGYVMIDGVWRDFERWAIATEATTQETARPLAADANGFNDQHRSPITYETG
jgi:ribosomal-protein-alanine N-acetyltransferase